MDMKKSFNAIIVDTNAFDSKKNDFCGFDSKSLPSFFENIKLLELQLLSHPILKGETLSHIGNGELKTRPEEAIRSLKRNKDILDLIGIKAENVIKSIGQLDLCSKTIEAFNKYFENAYILPFPDPAEIFNKYFKNDPPFNIENSKKSEFPDAFVIGAIEQYILEHPQVKLIVVTNDKDWISSLENNPQITFAKDIDSALTLLVKSNKIRECVNTLYPTISDYISNNAEMDVWFEVDNYVCQDDVEVESIRLTGISDEIVPLKSSDEELILQIKVDMEVDGSATVLDENNSIWDHEEKCYLFTEFSIMDFKDAIGNATAELYIRLDNGEEPILEHMSLIAPYGILLETDNDKVYFTRAGLGEDDYLSL